MALQSLDLANDPNDDSDMSVVDILPTAGENAVAADHASNRTEVILPVQLPEHQTRKLQRVSNLQSADRKSSRINNPPDAPMKLMRPPIEIDNTQRSAGGRIFQMLHNAIRRELVDLYDVILTAVERANYDVTEEDVAAFVQWWKVFFAFVMKYTDVEENLRSGVRLPLKKDKLLELTEATERLDTDKDSLMERAAEVRTVIEVFDENPEALVAIDFIECVDKFASSLLRFCDVLEKTLLPFFESKASQREFRDKGMDITTEFNEMECDYGPIILAAWMEDPKVLQEWIRNNLKGYAVERNREYVRMQAIYLDEHRGLLHRFVQIRKEATLLYSLNSGKRYDLPQVNLVETGPGWSDPEDLVTMTGNSVRHELQMLSKIANVMTALRFSNYQREMNSFGSWFHSFEKFLVAIFNAESILLFKVYAEALDSCPASEENDACTLNAKEVLDKLISHRVEVLGRMNYFHDIFQEYRKNPRQMGFDDLFERFYALDTFIAETLVYFELQESTFPEILRRSTKRDKLIQRGASGITDQIWTSQNPATNVVMLSRWMPQEKRSKWYKLTVYGSTRVMYYSSWKRNYAETRGKTEAFFEKHHESITKFAENHLRRKSLSIRSISREGSNALGHSGAISAVLAPDEEPYPNNKETVESPVDVTSTGSPI